MESEDDLFYSIYKDYYPILMLRAKALGIKAEDREDIVQETFASFYRSYHNKLEEVSYKALLNTILKNKRNDYFRKSEFHNMNYLEPEILEAQGWQHGQLKSPSPLDAILEQEKNSVIAEAFHSMRIEWRELIQLHIIQGRSIAEVSEIVGLAPTACRMRISRGRKYLKEILKNKEQP